MLQSVLYSSSAEQLSGWWTGFTDDISAISKLQIGLLSADTCQETGIDHMTTVVELTDIATDAKKFTFLGLQLQVTVSKQNISSYVDQMFLHRPVEYSH